MAEDGVVEAMVAGVDVVGMGVVADTEGEDEVVVDTEITMVVGEGTEELLPDQILITEEEVEVKVDIVTTDGKRKGV